MSFQTARVTIQPSPGLQPVRTWTADYSNLQRGALQICASREQCATALHAT